MALAVETIAYIFQAASMKTFIAVIAIAVIARGRL